MTGGCTCSLVHVAWRVTGVCGLAGHWHIWPGGSLAYMALRVTGVCGLAGHWRMWPGGSLAYVAWRVRQFGGDLWVHWFVLKVAGRLFYDFDFDFLHDEIAGLSRPSDNATQN